MHINSKHFKGLKLRWNKLMGQQNNNKIVLSFTKDAVEIFVTIWNISFLSKF